MRLDILLHEKGLAKSRTLAGKLIADGCVSVNSKIAAKPSQEVSAEDSISISESVLTRYVGRGGLKLEAALIEFSLDVSGLIAIDIGSSTGGFTDCLLQRGAARVYAVDSGRDQLDSRLSKDNRIVSMEGINARYLESEALPEKCDIAVMDVSFISQRLLYPTVRRFLKDNGILVSLIKPQFEVGRASLGKKGIVTDEKERMRAISELKAEAESCGLKMDKYIPSPIRGGDGNIEYLALFRYLG